MRLQLLHDLYHRSWPILSRAASLHRQTLAKNSRVVVVVGSFGKSTATRSAMAALGGKVVGLSQRNAGSFVARALLNIRSAQHHAVIEVGISRPGQMATYADMVRPDIAIVTSIGSEHLRSLGSLEVTRAEKAEMVRILPANGLAVLNGDDPNVLWMAGQTRAPIKTFGMSEANDIFASDLTLDWPHGTRFRLHADGTTRDMRIRLVGRHMVYSILAAVAVALGEGFSLDQILPALEALAPTPGRMEPVELDSGAIILRDDYKSPLETIDAALDVLSQIPAKRRIVVMGDVSEPPTSQGKIYRGIGERIGNMASCAILLTNKKCFQRYRTGIRRGGLAKNSVLNVEKSVLKAVDALQSDLGPGDVVLIKGRDTQRLERITFALTGQPIQCDINYCTIKVIRCEHCPALRRAGGITRRRVKR